MDLQPAPFFDDPTQGFGQASNGAAWWVTTSDEIRVRVGLWPAVGDARGTILLFPGRTEYIEKYGDTAAELTKRGYAVLAIDWRGQGLADRLLDDKLVGHVGKFTDFQKDIAALLRAGRELDIPRPFHLLAHSMGGAIGLRAVMEGLAVQTCAFTGPMWDIYMPALLRPIAWNLSYFGSMLGFGGKSAPSTNSDFYVLKQAFEGNILTHDPEMYKMMQDQLAAQMQLGIGGPSMNWLNEALSECKTLVARASPDMPCLTFLGTEEAIVDRTAIRTRMANWPRGTLEEIPAAHHEVLMEGPETRERVFARLDAHFSGKQDAFAASA